MKKSTSGAIGVAESAPKLPVENRISLRFYYRIADNILRQKLLTVLIELESLKAAVQLPIIELNRKRTIQENGWDVYDPSLEWSPTKNHARPNYEIGKIPLPVGRGTTVQSSLIQ